MAGKERLELTTCGFGDRCSSQLSYFPAREKTNLKKLVSAGFPMDRMLTLKFAILLLFQTLRSIAFFFHGGVVAAFALGTLHDDQFASHNSLSF